MHDNYSFRIVTGSSGEECVEAHCETRSYFVLIDHFFKIPVAHLEFLLAVFERIRRQSEAGEQQSVIWQQYWLSKALAIRALQDCHVGRRRGGYALNDKSRAFINALFINAVYWYQATHTNKKLPPEDRSREYFSYAIFEATKRLDAWLGNPQINQRRAELVSLLSRLPVHLTQDYSPEHPLVQGFTQNAVYAFVAAGESKSAWLDPDSLDIKFYRLRRFFDLALMTSSVTESELLEPQKIAV